MSGKDASTHEQLTLSRVVVHLAKDPLSGDLFVASRHCLDGREPVDEIRRFPEDRLGDAIETAQGHFRCAALEFAYGETFRW